MEPPTTTLCEPGPTHSSLSEGFSFTTYLFSFAIALMIYVLAPGPIAKFSAVRKRRITPAFRITFAPLAYAYDNSRFVQRFYNWYFKNVWHVP